MKISEKYIFWDANLVSELQQAFFLQLHIYFCTLCQPCTALGGRSSHTPLLCAIKCPYSSSASHFASVYISEKRKSALCPMLAAGTNGGGGGGGGRHTFPSRICANPKSDRATYFSPLTSILPSFTILGTNRCFREITWL